MQIILTEDVPNLGNMGDLVTVKPGYGRNYLIPRGLAVQATPGNKAQLAHTLRRIEERRIKLRAAAEDLGKQLTGLSITIARQSGDDDRLFGSVTNRDIEAALAALGHEIDRRRIMLKEPIRALGIYKVPVKLHSDVTSDVNVWVAAL
jgi:large subunit ribosomal protein L9